MLIGHINLSPSIYGNGEHFVRLVEALQQAGLGQYALVRDVTLAKRIDAIAGVDVGPVVHSPIMACCLLPQVDVAHVHEPSAGQAGLLLALTRSIPYVLTHRGTVSPGAGPLLQAVYGRAVRVLCQDDGELAVLRHWIPGLAVDVVPDLDQGGSAARHVRCYQNSQRIPTAGNNGIQ